MRMMRGDRLGIRGCRVAAGALMAVAVLAAPGCSVESGEVSRSGECPPLELTVITPPDGSVDVPTDSSFVYTFSDFPEPDTANSENFGIYSGPYYYTAHETVDLLRRRIIFKPTSALPRGLAYTLGLSTRVRSLRGCPLVKPPPVGEKQTILDSYYFSFRTVEPGVDVPATPAPPTPPTFADILTIMAARCAGCHLPAPGTGREGACLTEPAGGVSLCARQAHDSIVSITSRQVSRLAIVAPGDSARSYLLRKLLGAPPTTGHRGPPDNVITDDELASIQSWIDAGAREK